MVKRNSAVVDPPFWACPVCLTGLWNPNTIPTDLQINWLECRNRRCSLNYIDWHWEWKRWVYQVYTQKSDDTWTGFDGLLVNATIEAIKHWIYE